MKSGVESHMKKVVIFGTNSEAKELRHFVETDGYEVVAYTLDRQFVTDSEFNGRPLIAYEDLDKHFKKDETSIFIMLGYSNMNDNRKQIFEKCQKDGWMLPSFIHSSVLNLSKSIGKGNIIFPHVELGQDTVLGDGNLINRHAIISHDAVIGNFNYIAGSNHLCGFTRIGDHNFLGTNSTIIDNGEIGDYNLLSAGVCLNIKLTNNQLVTPPALRVRTLSTRVMNSLLLHLVGKG